MVVVLGRTESSSRPQQFGSYDLRVLESEESTFEQLAEDLAQQSEDSQDQLEETLPNTPLKRQHSPSDTNVHDIRPTGKKSRSALSSLDWSRTSTIDTLGESEIFADVFMGNNVEDSKWEAELIDLIYQKHLPSTTSELEELEDIRCQEEKSISTSKVCYGAVSLQTA